MSMRKTAAFGWLMLVAPTAGCGGGGTSPVPPQSTAPTESPCTVNSTYICTHSSAGCQLAEHVCTGNDPNTYGPCICQTAAALKVGPVDDYVDDVEAGAFGNDAFYWSEYHFVTAASYCNIAVSTPLGSSGKLLISNVSGRVSQLAITDSEIFVDGNSELAFSLTGAPLTGVTPTFPSAPTTQVTSTDTGLFLGSQQIGERAWMFRETSVAVFYIPYNSANEVHYVPLADLATDQRVVYWDGGVFTNLWILDTHLYLSAVADDRVTYTMRHADLSLVGR